MIPRLIEIPVLKALQKRHEVVLLLGPRQVGKTTVLKNFQAKLAQNNHKVLYLNCDISESLHQIDTTSLTLLSKLLNGTDYVLIDEAQRLSNPGLTLKIIHDEMPQTRVLATGSSSLDLKNRLSDPLTGRLIGFNLYPFSLFEVSGGDKIKMQYFLPQLMTTGLYPEVYLQENLEDRVKIITRIIDNYLFKDILEFEKVRQPRLIKELVTALAYQVGSEVNENELANRLKINRRTVVSYIDLLEKTFVIVRVFPFSQNPRHEIGKNYKIYFVDLGIRNALIGDFNIPAVRADIGNLWENFLVIERRKKFANAGDMINTNFWRSYGGAEIDYLERKPTEKSPLAFEFKFGQGKIKKGARSFEKKYKIKPYLINQENFSDFIS